MFKMSDNMRRKCFLCGRSPKENPAVKLYRFPNPGPKNIQRCEIWAKYCFPDQEWYSQEFQKKIYNEHRMLCQKNFKESQFTDFEEKKLNRSAIPEVPCIKVSSEPILSLEPITLQHNVVEVVVEPKPSPMLKDIVNKTNVPSESIPSMEPIPGPSTLQHKVVVLQPGPSPILKDITNILHNVPSEPMPSMEPIPGPSRLRHKVVELQQGPSPMLKDIANKTNAEAPIQRHVRASEKEERLKLRCRRQMKEICRLKNRIKNYKPKVVLKSLENDEDVNNLINSKIPSAFALLLQGQIKNFKRKARGRRWTNDEKIVALRMYKRSPTCYRLLRRLFCLPAPSSLKVLLGKLQMATGINKKIFGVLSKFISTLKPSQKEFVLMWDEMSIRKNLNYSKKLDIIEGFQDHAQQGRTAEVASHALVFMIAGIRKKVKQPIAFYFSGGSVTADRLSVIIKDVLRACFDIDINITATVCDQDGVNRKALKLLGATVEDPTIKIFNKVVVTLLDTPHLLKCFRNLFLKYDIECSTNICSNNTNSRGVAKWAHIQDFYDLVNKNPNFVFAPALRQEHLNPNGKQKMRVKLAAQVLSHTVAGGIFAKVAQGDLPNEALATANLLSAMDQLYDTLNADSTDLKKGKLFATNLKKNSVHISHFHKMKLFFSGMKFIGSPRAPPTQDGWIWTINAVERIWLLLSSKHKDIKSLATRRLQQDPIENLFGCIRGYCGSNSNPTVAQFVAGLKTSILGNLPNLGGNTNCETDSNRAIFNNFTQLFENQTHDIEILNGITQSCETSDLDDLFINTQENISEIQACAYVCGFIIKNCKNKCNICSEKVFLESQSDNLHLFVSFKEYDDVKKSLMYASKTIILCVEKCASFINMYLKHNSHKLHIYTNIKNVLNTYNFDFLNKCEQHKQENKQYIIKSVFHICVKRFCVLKNRKFMEEASRVALKKKIDTLKHI